MIIRCSNRSFGEHPPFTIPKIGLVLRDAAERVSSQVIIERSASDGGSYRLGPRSCKTPLPIATGSIAMIPPRLNSPIVLIHGLFGYDQLSLAGHTLRVYFRGIAEHFRARGNRVLVPRLSPTRCVAERAAQLKAFLLWHSPNEPVHLIGHSMGGLDARYLVSQLDMAEHVLSVTTIGTPHRGSSFADWMIQRFARIVLPILRQLSIPHSAFQDLTTWSCERFNQQVPDVPGVKYLSVAGDCSGQWLGMPWCIPYAIVKRHEGPNDGVVSVESARHGEYFEIWRGDHLNLVNWPNRPAAWAGIEHNRLDDWSRLLHRLRDFGF